MNLNFKLGSSNDNLNGLNGAYSSFALYNTMLSIPQHQQLEGYLAWK